MEGFLERHRLLRAALDVMPIAVLIIDRAFVLRDRNAAGAAFLGAAVDRTLGRLSGEALHCVNALGAPAGCGTSPACPDCPLRGAVGESLGRGAPVRRRWTLQRDSGQGARRQQLIVTAADLPGAEEPVSLVVIEDFSEFAELRSLVPICAACKKIRSDSDYWEQVENYLERHMDLTFTHGLCPACLENFFASGEEGSRGPEGGPGGPRDPEGQSPG